MGSAFVKSVFAITLTAFLCGLLVAMIHAANPGVARAGATAEPAHQNMPAHPPAPDSARTPALEAR
ncbi:MAG TPA: hypothetical protein VLX68_01540 [Chitinivibrionales bacterium]|nr:hypothetical protein [Chitinivibrionales bacterium]